MNTFARSAIWSVLVLAGFGIGYAAFPAGNPAAEQTEVVNTTLAAQQVASCPHGVKDCPHTGAAIAVAANAQDEPGEATDGYATALLASLGQKSSAISGCGSDCSEAVKAACSVAAAASCGGAGAGKCLAAGDSQAQIRKTCCPTTHAVSPEAVLVTTEVDCHFAEGTAVSKTTSNIAIEDEDDSDTFPPKCPFSCDAHGSDKAAAQH